MAPSYLIVGAGVFGTSTALHLKRKYPDAEITLVDRDAYTAAIRVAASWDWNKVVRADYRDIVYTRMALEAQELWRNDPLWQAFYHETGIYWISKTSFAQQVLNNFKELGVEADLKSVPVEEAKKLYNGLFNDADYTDVKEVLVNRSSGYADAKEALQAGVQAAVDLGVKYVQAHVVAVEFDGHDKGNCKGVRTASGDVITADKVILSTGSYTPKLLIDSDPQRSELHAGGRMISAGVTEGICRVPLDLQDRFRSMPVAIQELPTERGESRSLEAREFMSAI